MVLTALLTAGVTAEGISIERRAIGQGDDFDLYPGEGGHAEFQHADSEADGVGGGGKRIERRAVQIASNGASVNPGVAEGRAGRSGNVVTDLAARISNALPWASAPSKLPRVDNALSQRVQHLIYRALKAKPLLTI